MSRIGPTILVLVCALPLANATALAQSPNDFLRVFGGMVQQAMRQAAQLEWHELSPPELSCVDSALRMQGGSVDDLTNRGVLPSDPRLAQLRANCRITLVQNAQPSADQQSPYVVDGLALGGHALFESQAYKQYHCVPSEKFPGLTWCHKEETKKERHNEVLSSNSILHAPDGTAWYVNRYIEPAFFGTNDVQTEIERLSAKFGERPRESWLPPRQGLPNAVIAVWGRIELEQIDASDASIVAAGGTVKGLLISYLGDLQRSAKAGVPVYRLAGGPGFLWAATFDTTGRGVLRFLTVDASRLASPNVAATDSPAQQQTQACTLAAPGPGFSVSEGRYVITREAFDIRADVESAVKATFGDDATLADWQNLKRLFSAQTQLSNFIQQVGIPNQAVNGPCDNFLVSNNGRYRLDNGYWLFVARHDGIVPGNWAVLDSIGNHTLDLGRWTHKSQALVFIPNTTVQPLTSNTSPPSATPSDEQRAQRQAVLENAKQVAEEPKRRRIAVEEEIRRVGVEVLQRIEAARQQQNITLAASAGIIILLCSVVAIVLIRRRKLQAVVSAPRLAVHTPKIRSPHPTTKTPSWNSEWQQERGDIVEQLAKFAKLHADSALTDEEFKSLKASLVGPHPPGEGSPSEYVKHLKELRDTGVITEAEFQSTVLAFISSTS